MNFHLRLENATITDVKSEIINQKTKKHKIILFSVLATVIVAIASAVAILLFLSRVDYVLADTPTYEVNSDATISSLFFNISSGILKDGETLLDTAEIGERTKELTLVSRLGTEQIITAAYIVVDTTPPTISGDETELSFESGANPDILSHFEAEDNSKAPVELSLEGNYDPGTPGDYNVKVVAKDTSGNTSAKEIVLKITEPPRPARNTAAASNPYYIEVNREQNVVIVYSRDKNGVYSNIAKVFVASTGAPGSETPLGTFTVTDRHETLYLVGNVWGHYTLRINGHIFFHSVPYFSKGAPWDNLEYLEYNKLGSGASAGCVRLATADAKWIYDNITYGTTVKIYDSPTLPAGVTKPQAIKIDENSLNRGWDPTDPDPGNPWRQ